MNEEQINEMFHGTDHDDKIEKQIQRGIQNNIYRRAIIVVLASCVLLGMTAGGIQLMKEKTSFHLSDWEDVVDEEWVELTVEENSLNDRSQVNDILNTQAYISAYCSIFLPGVIPEFSELSIKDADAVTYGTYYIGGTLTDYFEINPENEPYRMNAEENSSYIEIRDGRVIADQRRNILNDGSVVLSNPNSYEIYSGLQEGEFYSHFRFESTEHKTESYIQELEKLPESAVVNMDIRLREPSTVYNLLRSTRNYTDSRIVYAVTDYIPQEKGYEEGAIGFSLIGGNGPSDFREPYQSLTMDDTLLRDKSYFQQGMFYLNNRASFFGEPDTAAKHMEDMYVSQLELLIDQQLLSDRELHAAETALEDAKQNGITVIGYRIFASRDDALKLLRQSSTLRSHILSVKIGMFSIGR